jgi:NhaP-type Na+/H+ or K+/H+ antiporter
MLPLALFIGLIFIYGLVSRRLEQTILTAPILFAFAGMLFFPMLPAIAALGLNAKIFLRLAEVGLVLLLFTDASRTDLSLLRK